MLAIFEVTVGETIKFLKSVIFLKQFCNGLQDNAADHCCQCNNYCFSTYFNTLKLQNGDMTEPLDGCVQFWNLCLTPLMYSPMISFCFYSHSFCLNSDRNNSYNDFNTI
jgi:hypothetical protein